MSKDVKEYKEYQLLKDYGISYLEATYMLESNPVTLYKWLNGNDSDKCKLMTRLFAEKMNTTKEKLVEKYNLSI